MPAFGLISIGLSYIELLGKAGHQFMITLENVATCLIKRVLRANHMPPVLSPFYRDFMKILLNILGMIFLFYLTFEILWAFTSKAIL